MYQHDLHAYDDDWVNMDDIDDTPVFNINTHIHDIQAYASKVQKSKPPFDTSGHLPPNIYEDMDDQSRSSWRKISPQIRTKIVQSMKSSPSSYSSVQKKTSTYMTLLSMTYWLTTIILVIMILNLQRNSPQIILPLCLMKQL